MSNKVDNSKRKYVRIGIGVVVIILIAVLFFCLNKNNYEIESEPVGPAFSKVGSLAFISKNTNDTLKAIDIEVANTDEKREMGLMYRRSMKDSEGMLFIFDVESEHSFWMKNTYISLDIIFINSKQEIVFIQESAVPLSEASIPSMHPAQFVVEVNAGFCFKYKIHTGDLITYSFDPK